MDKSEVQFSIYKISKTLVCNELRNLNVNSSAYSILDKLVFYIYSCIKKGGIGKDSVEQKKYGDFTVLYFTCIREPLWKNLIRGMFNDKEMEIYNHSASYLIFTIVNDEIYSMTGGRGSNYIGKFIEKNFGLYLLPKIIEKDNRVLKKIVENNIGGNNLTTRRVTKSATSVLSEEEINSIYKELSICVSTSMAKELGIDLEESKRMISVSSGDSFVINKSISLNELKTVLNTISDISKRDDKFALNYFVPCEKKRKKTSDLDYIMNNAICNQNYNIFEVIPDNVEYYFSSYKYALIFDDKTLIESENEIKMEDIVSKIYEIKNGKISFNFIKNFIKSARIVTYDSNGISMLNETVYNSLRGVVEEENESFYFLNGKWYVFEDYYFELLDKGYKELFDYNEKELKKINIDSFNIVSNDGSITENDYNNSFKERDDVLVLHNHFIKKIEIADLMFWNDNNLFLMCNKRYFNGPDTRDLLNQMETSFALLSHVLESEKVRLEEYYSELPDSEKNKIDLEKFVKLFEKKIIYIAGYGGDFSRDTTSIYIKYTLKELSKKIKGDKYQLCIMNYLKK